MTCHDVAVVGAEIGGFTTLDGEVTSAVFDDDTDTWTLTTSDGEIHRARLVITAQTPLVPWIPELPGRNGFHGPAFHAAAPDPDFDPADKRVAVIGADSSAGRLIGWLAGRAANVEVFAHPPRRVVGTTRRRWRRPSDHPVISQPIDTVTASGIRTCDGVHHDADAIIYGTGFTVADQALVGTRGLTIQQAWRDGTEPYLGVAMHGFPNYFLVDGPEAARYVVECLQLMDGPSRIEVRRSTQQVFNERVHVRPPGHRLEAAAFDLSSGIPDETYDGPALLTAADLSQQVHVHLIGNVDPIDGQYHWQGTVFDRLPADLLKRDRAVTLAVGERKVAARITEETPQGTHSIAGIGAPPFALTDFCPCPYSGRPA